MENDRQRQQQFAAARRLEEARKAQENGEEINEELLENEQALRTKIKELTAQLKTATQPGAAESAPRETLKAAEEAADQAAEEWNTKRLELQHDVEGLESDLLTTLEQLQAAEKTAKATKTEAEAADQAAQKIIKKLTDQTDELQSRVDELTRKQPRDTATDTATKLELQKTITDLRTKLRTADVTMKLEHKLKVKEVVDNIMEVLFKDTGISPYRLPEDWTDHDCTTVIKILKEFDGFFETLSPKKLGIARGFAALFSSRQQPAERASRLFP